jgi:hypothetical protein
MALSEEVGNEKRIIIQMYMNCCYFWVLIKLIY